MASDCGHTTTGAGHDRPNAAGYAAIKRDEAARAAARKAHEGDVDQQQHEMALLKEDQATVRKQADATNDVRHDITQDRSAERTHSESSHHR